MSINTWEAVNTWIAGTSTPAISAVSSPEGADTAQALGVITITVNDPNGIASVTINGEPCTGVSNPNGNIITAICPRNFAASYGTVANVVVNNGEDSNAYPVTLFPPDGMTATAFTVDYNNLDSRSPFADDFRFSGIEIGVQAVYDELTTPDSNPVTMNGEGLFTVTGVVSEQQFDYYFYRPATQTVGQIEQITVQKDIVTHTHSASISAGVSSLAIEKGIAKDIPLPVAASIVIEKEIPITRGVVVTANIVTWTGAAVAYVANITVTATTSIVTTFVLAPVSSGIKKAMQWLGLGNRMGM